jgi:hypothetical protein
MAGNAWCNPEIGNTHQSYRISTATSSAEDHFTHHGSSTATALTLRIGDVFKGNVAFADPHLIPAELSLFIVDISHGDADRYEYDIEAIAVVDIVNERSTYGYRGGYDARHGKLALSNSDDIQPDKTFPVDEQTDSIPFKPVRLTGSLDENGQTIHLNFTGIGNTTLQLVDEAFNLDKAIETAVMYIKAYEEELQ